MYKCILKLSNNNTKKALIEFFGNNSKFDQIIFTYTDTEVKYIKVYLYNNDVKILSIANVKSILCQLYNIDPNISYIFFTKDNIDNFGICIVQYLDHIEDQYNTL